MDGELRTPSAKPKPTVPEPRDGPRWWGAVSTTALAEDSIRPIHYLLDFLCLWCARAQAYILSPPSVLSAQMIFIVWPGLACRVVWARPASPSPASPRASCPSFLPSSQGQTGPGRQPGPTPVQSHCCACVPPNEVASRHAAPQAATSSARPSRFIASCLWPDVAFLSLFLHSRSPFLSSSFGTSRFRLKIGGPARE